MNKLDEVFRPVGGCGNKTTERDRIKDAEDAVRSLRSKSCILTDKNKGDILEGAMRDGSSVVCNKCGGLIKRDRWNNHVEFWCGGGGLEEEDEEEGGDMMDVS